MPDPTDRIAAAVTTCENLRDALCESDWSPYSRPDEVQDAIAALCDVIFCLESFWLDAARQAALEADTALNRAYRVGAFEARSVDVAELVGELQ